MSRSLDARDVDVVFTSGFGGRVANTAVRGISMHVGGEAAAVTAIVGESGSGKTTLTRLLLGFQAPTRGGIFYGDRNVAEMGNAELTDFRRNVQAIFQDPFDVFNPFYKIDHPLIAPLRRFGFARSKAEAYAIIEKAMETVGLRPQETLGKYPHQLSGGQRQRTMIARALSLDPSIILADEPVSMVDASLRSTILELLYRMNRDNGISLIYVTHDLTTAYQVADTIMVLYGGQVMEIGTGDEVIHDPKHPYTRALIEAVPSPDPDVEWHLGATSGAVDTHATPEIGCPFAPRCPQAMPACTSKRPELYRTDETRSVACLLYESGSVSTAGDIQRAAAARKANVA